MRRILVVWAQGKTIRLSVQIRMKPFFKKVNILMCAPFDLHIIQGALNLAMYGTDFLRLVSAKDFQLYGQWFRNEAYQGPTLIYFMAEKILENPQGPGFNYFELLHH